MIVFVLVLFASCLTDTAAPQELDLAACAVSHGVPELQSAVSFTSQPATTTTSLIRVTVITTKTTTVHELTTSLTITTTSHTTRPINTTTSRSTTSTIFTGGSEGGIGPVKRGLLYALAGVLSWVVL